MANKRIYTKIEIEAIKQGLNHYFPYELGETSGPKIVDDKWSDLNKIFRWMGRDDFFTTLSESTGIQKLSFTEIKGASGILEKMERSAPETAEFKGAEESPVSANRPSKGTLEQMEEESQVKEAKRKEILEQSNRDVRAAIEKQKENYAEQIQKAKMAEAALKDKKIYYKVEKTSVEETQEVKNLRQQAQADPKKFIEDAAKEYAKNPNIKNLTAEEMDVVTKQAGVTSYDVLTDNSPLIQSVVIGRAVSDPKFINSIPDADTRESIKNIADILTNQKIAQFELSKQFIDFSKIDGYKNAGDIKIEFSDTPQPGFKEFNYNDQLTSPHIDGLNQQSFLLDNVRGLGEGEIKSQMLLAVGKRFENYINTLPANSLLAKTYNSEIVQLGLSSFGVVPAVPWTAIEGSWIGKIAIGSGYGNVAGFIQSKTGINLGVKLATKTGAETAVKAGVTTVAKTGFKAGFSKITAAIASIIPVPILNWIIGWVVGELLVKIAEKIPWKKIKEFSAVIIGGFMGLVVLPFIGIGGAVGIGLGATGIAAAFGGGVGGLTLAGFGRGILNFFRTIAGATLGAIGTPILITLIVFPLAIALILFIINSGAYMVPPSISSLGSQNQYIDISKEASPAGPFKNSDLPIKITYTITVTAKQQTLTGVTIKDVCSAISKGGSKNCSAPSINVPGGSISVGLPFIFTYETTYNSSYQDTLVVNTVTVSAKVTNESDIQTTSGGTTVTIGTPPTGCLKIEGSWPANYRTNMESAIGILASEHSDYLSKVCLSYTELPLRYNPAGSGSYWGWNRGTYIDFYSLGVKNPDDALYILSHELGHSLSWGEQTTYIFASYVSYRGINSEAPYCFYHDTLSWNINESLPEAIALKIIEPRCGSVQSKWPIHYQFLKKYIFN